MRRDEIGRREAAAHSADCGLVTYAGRPVFPDNTTLLAARPESHMHTICVRGVAPKIGKDFAHF